MHELKLWVKDLRLMIKRMILFATTIPQGRREFKAWVFLMALWIVSLTIIITGLLKHIYSYSP